MKNVLLLALLFIRTTAIAGTIQGTAINRTSGVPAAGDEVVVIAPSANGMTELGRTKSDSAGRFTFAVADKPQQWLVRVIHQGVTYHQLVAAGQPVNLNVYDVAVESDGLVAATDVLSYETDGDVLRVHEVITMRNSSNPPRTLMSTPGFEVHLPAGATLDTALTQSPGAPPVKQVLTTGDAPGQYFFQHPVRPGETRFGISYHLPYESSATVQTKMLYPAEHLVLITPRSMAATPQNTARAFESSQGRDGAIVLTTSSLLAGETLELKISGTGVLERPAQSRAASASTDAGPRPGDGLAEPVDAPDSLDQVRWSALIALVFAVMGAGIYVRRSRSTISQTAGRRRTRLRTT